METKQEYCAILKKSWNLEATHHKTTNIWPPTTHLTNHPSKTKKTCWVLLKKEGFDLVWFYGISTIVGYLMPNPLSYI